MIRITSSSSSSRTVWATIEDEDSADQTDRSPAFFAVDDAIQPAEYKRVFEDECRGLETDLVLGEIALALREVPSKSPVNVLNCTYIIACTQKFCTKSFWSVFG